jgi:hypothetical protein
MNCQLTQEIVNMTVIKHPREPLNEGNALEHMRFLARVALMNGNTFSKTVSFLAGVNYASQGALDSAGFTSWLVSEHGSPEGTSAFTWGWHLEKVAFPAAGGVSEEDMVFFTYSQWILFLETKEAFCHDRSDRSA